MSDLIDRQQAIDAIQNLNIPEDMCVFEIMSHIEVEIATLPSVQSNDTNVPTNSALDHIHNVVAEREYQRGYEQGRKEGES